MSNDEHGDQLRVAYEALHAGHFKKAYEMYALLARSGDATAEISLGWMQENGAGVEADIEIARGHYLRAEAAGSTLASYYLARLEHSRGSFESALRGFQRAAAADHLPSIYWTGSMLLKGEGCVRNIEAARKHLETAAARGHFYARRDLGLALLRGTFAGRALLRGTYLWLQGVVGGALAASRDTDDDRLM